MMAEYYAAVFWVITPQLPKKSILGNGSEMRTQKQGERAATSLVKVDMIFQCSLLSITTV